MEFVTITLGRPDLVFPTENRVRIPFTLPGPAKAVYPIIQSFRFYNYDDDRHVESVQIGLTPLFNSGVSATQGEVEIETSFNDADHYTPDRIELEITVLIVAV
ncbi:MAG: hypothetical protein QM783_13595 [Phycisphaerales bacterium]